MSPLPEQESAQATAESFVNAVVEADYETVGRLTLERALSAEETDVLREGGRRVNESAYVVVVAERDGAWYVTESP